MIYLDNAATTYPKPEAVYQEMDLAFRNLAVNPGRGSYKKAKLGSEVVQETKEKIRRITAASPNAPVVFSPSITVALNQIIRGYDWPEDAVIYISPYEHNAVARTLHDLEKQGRIQVNLLPLDPVSHEIDLQMMAYEFSRTPPVGVICTHISNVTGYILPILQIFKESKKYHALTVLDTAQSLGLLEISIELSRFTDILAFTGHKGLYGPMGIGGFVNNANIPLNPVITGGTGSDSLNLEMPGSMEGAFEPSSINVPAISGLSVALDQIEPSVHLEHQKALQNMIVDGLRDIEGVRIIGHQRAENYIGIISFIVVGISSEDIAQVLDEEYDIAVRSGYHCAPYIHEIIFDLDTDGTVRVSPGQFTTPEEIATFLEKLQELLLTW